MKRTLLGAKVGFKNLLLIIPLILASFPLVADGGTYDFTPINVPGATSTVARDINNSGKIVGYYLDSSFQVHGFLFNGGYAPLDVPFVNATETIPRGINNLGQVVGDYRLNSDPPNIFRGFFFNGSNFFPLNFPGSLSTRLNGINDSGQIVGYYNTSTGGGSFIFSGGIFNDFVIPGQAVTPYDINNNGEIIGIIPNPSGFGFYGFLYSGGSFDTSMFPPASSGSIISYGINDAGEIVAEYLTVGGFHGLLIQSGGFSLFDVPGEINTITRGINDSGQIVGSYQDNAGASYGFLATPTPIPEPATMLLLGSGLIGLAGYGRRKFFKK